jgi:hypothetical protein
MVDKLPQADRILCAQLSGVAKRHARRPGLSGAGWDAAVAELRELAAGRADLLARLAGLAEGFGRGQPDEASALTVAAMARDAGADPDEIAGWIAIGRERRATANLPPFSGGRRGGGASAAGLGLK